MVEPLHNEAGALELAAMIRGGALSPLEACDAAIGRIEAADPAINAVIVRDFERAREAAKHCKPSGPLGGVPMTVKESFNVAGLKTTWGYTHARDFVAGDDALVVKRLKAAGAIILGKTNVPVALSDLQAANPIYGRTLNPYDPDRVPGGSSGASAAALASGMVPLEFGSDIGGSIRTPAHFCGVFGLKPTYGAISGEGHWHPGTETADTPMSMVGPMARSARDLAAALAVTERLPLPPARHHGLSGLRILVIERHPLADVDAPVAGAIRAMADLAANAGAIVAHRGALPDLEAQHANYTRMLNLSMAAREPNPRPYSFAQWLDQLDLQAANSRAWDRLFADVDVVFAPAFGTTAFPHDDEPDIRKRTLWINGRAQPFAPQFAFAGLATYPGLPSCSVPIGDDGRLPIGMQVIAPAWRDHDAIAVAGRLHEMVQNSARIRCRAGAAPA